MNGGELRRKVVFFEFGMVPDGAGGFTPNAIKIIKLNTLASVKQIKATRTAENLQEAINSVFEIKLRQRAGFKPKSDYIVECDTRLCNIIAVDEDLDKGRWWKITVVTNPLLKMPADIIVIEDPYTPGEFENLPSDEPYTVPEYNTTINGG